MKQYKTDFFLMLLSVEVNTLFESQDCNLIEIREFTSMDEQFFISKKNKNSNVKLTPKSKIFFDENKKVLGIKLQDQKDDNEIIITIINNFDLQKEGEFEVGFMSIKNNICLPKTMLGIAKVAAHDEKFVISFHFNHQENKRRSPIIFEGNLNLLEYYMDEVMIA